MIGDIVRYNFFTLDDADKETYSLDYAIVLDKDEENEIIKILPFTSKYNKDSIESFCIGNILGFVEIKNEGYVNNKQYVHFDKIMDVNVEELYPVYHQDVYGRIRRDSFGDPINVKLADEQLDLVASRYGIYEVGEERNIINLLIKADPKYVINTEENDIDNLRQVCDKEMDKYREYNFSDKKIVVFFVDGDRYSVVMQSTNNDDLEFRNAYLKKIFS